MYQIKCDDYVLYDPRDGDLQLLRPKINLEANKVGEGSFTILPSHPYYSKLKRLKSVFSVLQDGQTIFRGRMTNDSRDFDNRLDVDLEGVGAYTNDTIIPPFTFPDDFTIPDGSNVVQVLLNWGLSQHNGQVPDWQKLKLGTVTVTDPNNVIVRSSTKYLTTWKFLQEKLFDSSLGGYLCFRYEADGTYVDYLSSFPLTNTQRVTFGENLLDVVTEADASETYSAILPTGKSGLTLADQPDGDLDTDLVKSGLYIYSRSAVEAYGWICYPPDDAVWSDVTDATNLQTKAAQKLSGEGMMVENTTTITAVDLGITDDQIQSFRVNRNILVDIPSRDLSGASYPLTKLSIDILQPQNTKITIGSTQQSLTGINDDRYSDSIQRIESAAEWVEGVNTDVTQLHTLTETLQTTVNTTAEAIELSALKEFTETGGDLSSFRETVESQLKIMAEDITMKFTTTTEFIQNVDWDLQNNFTQLRKYIRFSGDGIEIGETGNALKLSLDNDMIRFTHDGITVGWWNGSDFHTGNMVVEVNERAQFGAFAFVPRSDGSLMFLKVGG